MQLKQVATLPKTKNAHSRNFSDQQLRIHVYARQANPKISIFLEVDQDFV